MKSFNQVKKYGAKIGSAVTGVGLAVGTTLASALTVEQEAAIQAGFDANQASGENVGIMVVMFVLALAVIGLIINMVRKH